MRLTQAAAAVLGVWLSFGVVAARGGDWSSIMRDEPVIAKGAAVREEAGDHPRKAAPLGPQYTPAGVTKLIDGYFYTADGAGTWKFCEACNGCTFEQALAKYNAARVVPQNPFTQGPSSAPSPPSRPGSPSTPAIGVNNAGRLSTQSPGFYRAASTFTGVSMGMSGGIRGCSTGG